MLLTTIITFEGALLRCKDILLDRKIRVVGLDYDADYVMEAQLAVKKANMEHCISVVDMSVYDAERLQGKLSIPGEATDKPRFDAIYFSGSFSLLPDMSGALTAVVPLLKKGTGQIYITQTYQRYAPPLMSFLKPLLRYMITIDFGQLVMEEKAKHFFENEVPEKCKLRCVEHEVIKGSVDTFMQAAYLTILKPKV